MEVDITTVHVSITDAATATSNIIGTTVEDGEISGQLTAPGSEIK